MYQNLVNCITSNFVDFLEELSERSTKSGQNKRENFKNKAKNFYVNNDKLFRDVPGFPPVLKLLRKLTKMPE